jgi:hypothetical protein
MDLPPSASDIVSPFVVFGTDRLVDYSQKRARLNSVLEEYGLRYFRGGQVLPNEEISSPTSEHGKAGAHSDIAHHPASVEQVLETIIRGLPRAIHPLTHRRKGFTSISVDSEYDIQDFLHCLLRPWIADIRPEENTPSCAGSSSRMDFALPKYMLVLETKRIRDRSHASKLGDEIIVDIEHYRKHPKCKKLWCIVYDPQHFITNPSALADLEGLSSRADGSVHVRMFVI